MGRQNLGLFLPGETAYKDPGRFRDALSAEAVKEASYLSQMDQFYADLAERKREFDLASSQKERLQQRELEFKGSQNEADRQLKKWSQETDIEFQKGEGEAERDLKRDLGEDELDVRRRGQDIERDLGHDKLDVVQRGQDIQHDTEMGRLSTIRRGQDIAHSEWGDEFDEVQRRYWNSVSGGSSSGGGSSLITGDTGTGSDRPIYDPGLDVVENAKLPSYTNDFGVVQSRLNPDTGLWEEYNTATGRWVTSSGY